MSVPSQVDGHLLARVIWLAMLFVYGAVAIRAQTLEVCTALTLRVRNPADWLCLETFELSIDSTSRD